MGTQDRQVLREIRFTGGRFEETEGWLDLDVLAELLNYKEILIAIVREIWLREHQGSECLPRGFAQDFRLGISEIGADSCSVRLECFAPETRFHQTERLYNAARLVDETLLAAQDAAPLPKEMMAAVLPMFAKWGKKLQPDEWIELGGETGRHAVFNSIIRQRIASNNLFMAPGPAMESDTSDPLSTGESLLRMFDEIRKSVPSTTEDEAMPSDLSRNYKHYLYGFPKDDA